MVNFFINRPIFATVVSIVITLIGAICIVTLPVAQYPDKMSPPMVQVQASYNGASAGVVEETVAAPIEQEVNGAQDMIYMNSVSSNDGRMVLNVSFDVDRNLELATVDVQNRVQLAQPKLPNDVRQSGISVKKQSPDMVLAINLISPDGSRDSLFLENYARINIVDALARIPGVGNVFLVADLTYGMRIWLDPNKLAKLGLTATDVANALREQNLQAPAGQLGQQPAPENVPFQLTVQVKGRLTEVSEFENIIIRAEEGGEIVRIRDVGRVELGAQSYKAFTRLNGKPTSTILIYQLPGANAIELVQKMRAQMAESATYFPSGVEYRIPYDTTKFVDASIESVIHTLFEAIALVLIVVFIFLQNWRATVIPMIAVPVSLVGTFALFPMFGFSINTISLFALVLAIGIVVDDAIVVVEAVQHKIDHDKLPPKEATIAAMKEVAGPIIAISLVLMSVFLPASFMGGTSGRLYQQFALTVAISVGFSAINALTLSPALCALMLKPGGQTGGLLGRFFTGFNNIFNAFTRGYGGVVRKGIRMSLLTLLLLGAVYAGTFGVFKALPTAFVPDEDMGYFFVNVLLPEAASLHRSDTTVQKVEKILMDDPGIADVIVLGGFNILTSGYSSYTSMLIPVLKPWDERTSPELSIAAIMGKAQAAFNNIPEARINVLPAPVIPGMGSTGGYTFELQSRGGGTLEDLAGVSERFTAEARKSPDVAGLFTDFSVTVPQIFFDVDRSKVKTQGVPLADVFETMQTFLGGLYVNDFNKFGRTYRVMVQAEPNFRLTPEDIGQFYVRSANGRMLPLSTLGSATQIKGPEYVRRYNLFRTVEFSSGPAPGKSSGQLMASMEKAAREVMPQGYGFEWSGIAYQEKSSGAQSAVVFGLALVMVFLVLAAQYESWAIPFAVIFSIPCAVLGALGAQMARGFDNNVYAQIGLVVLIGLAAKNAILIVEFAKMRREEGMGVADAAVDASTQRFRPILMTSFAFILGVVPLALSSGAGGAARSTMGTAVFGGMTIATAFGVIFVPVLYYVIQSFADRFGGKKKDG